MWALHFCCWAALPSESWNIFGRIETELEIELFVFEGWTPGLETGRTKGAPDWKENGSFTFLYHLISVNLWPTTRNSSKFDGRCFFLARKWKFQGMSAGKR